ncbi:lycopene cyclase domain-containing protein [Daejeonella sp.]|jgi:lycopene cyclase domain-containing protein|uniref:lycopene cyclase domain-containing protein n=1 Tax=Daejeonella sp. TaxID=2805397 RepID=UPI0037843BCA
MKFSYLLINFLTVFFPVVLSFDKRVAFFKSWRFIFPGLLITGLLFLFWDYLFTIYGVWSFNPEYIIGFNILNLPIEEILFFITVPFACVFVYECLNYYVKTDLLKRFSSPISYILIAFSGLMVFLYYDRVYSLITFGLLAVVLIVSEFIVKSTIMSRFYLAYLVSLIPFYIVNGLLTSIPIVLYNDAENMAIRVGTIPLEDHFYSLSMLLINILLFEYFRKKGAVAK